MFVCLCSYRAICSDLIVTQLSSGLLAQEGRGCGGGSGEGMGLFSHPKEGEGPATLCLEARVPWGVHTLLELRPLPPGRHTLSLTLSGRNLPYRPDKLSPHPSTLRGGWLGVQVSQE